MEIKLASSPGKIFPQEKYLSNTRLDIWYMKIPVARDDNLFLGVTLFIQQ
jgi:hypothetical protein